MALEVRRVVTGHDAAGKSVVLVDEITKTFAQRPGAEGALIWTTEGFPISNDDSDDASRELRINYDDGTLFRVLSIGPGVTADMHRTQSLDYAVVMSGAVDMDLDESTVRLEAGDVLVQRGTAHRWTNNGSEPCVMAFIMMGSKVVEVGGLTLGPTSAHRAPTTT